MFSFLLNERRRRHLIPVVVLALAAGYLFVLLPLGRRADQLNEPLNKAWRTLSASLGQTNNMSIDFVGLTNQIDATRQAVVALEKARQRAASRSALDAELRERMNAPFQLVDYENERGALQDSLRKLAAKHKVTVAPAVFDGFPAHTTDVRQPALLWVQLAFVQELLTAAIQGQVSGIQALSVPTVLTNPPPLGGQRALTEIPLQIELVGEAGKVARFLERLPLRTGELEAAGLPATTTNKPALFLDRMVLRKQSPEKPEEIRASFQIVGFVFRE